MKCINNVELYFKSYSDCNCDVIAFWGPELNKLFPWRDKTWIENIFLSNNNFYKTLENEYKNYNKKIPIIDNICLIYEFDEDVYGHGLTNFIQCIEDIPKHTTIVVTNFCNYITELYEYYKKQGYNILNKKETKELLCNKRIIFKNFVFNEKLTIQASNKLKFDYSKCREYINKKNIVFLRGDAAAGCDRYITNKSDLISLFKKYNFLIKNSFADLSLYEKKIYMNNFKNIFIESGSGLTNLFLIDNPKNHNVYNLQAPTYNSYYIYDDMKDLNVIELNFGSLKNSAQTADMSPDNNNRPWEINLSKLEDVLKNL